MAAHKRELVPLTRLERHVILSRRGGSPACLARSVGWKPPLSDDGTDDRHSTRAALREPARAGEPGLVGPAVPELFKRFRRGAARRDTGAGLGLAICQVIALAHGCLLVARNGAVGAGSASRSKLDAPGTLGAMTETISAHPLDNVFWSALAIAPSHRVLGDALARRFRPEFAVFGGIPQRSVAAFQAMAALMRAGEVVAIAEADDIDPGPLFDVVDRKNLVQMVGVVAGTVTDAERFVALGPADVPRMSALVAETAPGPWSARTPELGRFLGFEADGRLVAMAGERLRAPGHTEISAVCCHPDFRGRGLATALMRLVSQAIVARGEMPFLHALAENASALALYERLGLRRRQQRRLAILRRNERAV
jgi:ribosomal protein S18 acetylase RimI-like enzyme